VECPHCGEEIDEVLEKGSREVAYEAVWKEVPDSKGVFEYYNEPSGGEEIDKQTYGVVCPKCGKLLNYKIEKGKMVIGFGV